MKAVILALTVAAVLLSAGCARFRTYEDRRIAWFDCMKDHQDTHAWMHICSK